MKKLIATLLCLSCCMSLAACDSSDTNIPDNQVGTTETAENTNQTIDCKYFDTESEQFTDRTIITLTVPSYYTETEQSSLRQKNPIYQIAEFISDKKSISVFQYADPGFDITDNLVLADNWYISATEESSKTFYTTIDDTIIGISISNTNKTELTIPDAVAGLNYLLSTKYEYVEQEVKPDYAEASLSNPAKIGDWISFRHYNTYSKKYEPILFSITKLYVDQEVGSHIKDYNNDGKTKCKIDRSFEFIDLPEYKINNGLNDIIYEYSIFYPSDYSCENGVVTDTEVEIVLCNETDSSSTIKGDINICKTVHDFNDLYQRQAEIGKDFTEGMGTFCMFEKYNKYLIKINTPDGPKYFTPAI